VAVAARDPGAAAALAPVARKLLSEGVEAAAFALTPVAAAAFARGGVGSVGGDPPPAKVLLSGTSTRPDLDAALWASARSTGARVVALVDHWTGLAARFPGDPPDLVCVIDDESRAALLDAGLAAERVVAVGHPALDDVVARAPDRRGASDGRVVFVSEPLSLLPDPPLIDEHAAAAIMAEALEAVPAPLLVRAHPREDPEEVLRRFAPRTPAGAEPLLGDPLPALAGASAAVGMGSMLLVEAALLGTPAAAIRTEKEAAHFPGSAIEGLVCTLPTAGACAEFLRRALTGRSDPTRVSLWARARGLDGTAAGRAAQHVLDRL
jgi:hypothetical protein